MTNQLTITGDERVVELTRRQQHALEQIERHEGGLQDDELGAVLHQYRSAHSADQRCRFCGQEGKSMGRELRAKGFVVRRRSGFWQSLRPAAERAA